CSTARLHADQTWRQRAQQWHQISTLDLGLEQHHLARLIDAMHRKNILGKVNTNCNNSHDFPFRINTRMETSYLPIMALDARRHTSVWLVRDGEVPCIR